MNVFTGEVQTNGLLEFGIIRVKPKKLDSDQYRLLLESDERVGVREDVHPKILSYSKCKRNVATFFVIKGKKKKKPESLE